QGGARGGVREALVAARQLAERPAVAGERRPHEVGVGCRVHVRPYGSVFPLERAGRRLKCDRKITVRRKLWGGGRSTQGAGRPTGTSGVTPSRNLLSVPDPLP